MIENRHAVSDGVLQRARGGSFGLCQSAGQEQEASFGPRNLSGRTTRRERQHRGSWKGELGLRPKAVLSVLRQPVAIPLPVNERTIREKETKSCSTQRVGAAAQTLLETSSSAGCGEALVGNCDHQDRVLVDPAPVAPAWGPYRPLPLTNLRLELLLMINEALRLVRVFHNVKQKDLADALGLSPSHLSEIESGKKQVTMELLEKYADYFKIPASSLLYFAEHRNKRGNKRLTHPIAAKALQMLDWLETITRDDEEDDEETVPA